MTWSTRMPPNIRVAHPVWTDRIVGEPSPEDRSIVHQLCTSTTACGLHPDAVPHQISAGYAALITATWCPRCFPPPSTI
jgi:hypothetical protein